MLNPVFSVIFGLLALALIVAELVGVFRPQSGDTITENWNAIDSRLKRQPAIRWFYRVFTAGFLVWIVLHFLVGVS